MEKTDGSDSTVVTVHYAGKKKAPVWSHDKLAITIKDKDTAKQFYSFIRAEKEKHGTL